MATEDFELKKEILTPGEDLEKRVALAEVEGDGIIIFHNGQQTHIDRPTMKNAKPWLMAYLNKI